ncbi:hypothetical protein ACP4OV_022062 [Aristida adscensionis]
MAKIRTLVAALFVVALIAAATSAPAVSAQEAAAQDAGPQPTGRGAGAKVPIQTDLSGGGDSASGA